MAGGVRIRVAASATAAAMAAGAVGFSPGWQAPPRLSPAVELQAVTATQIGTLANAALLSAPSSALPTPDASSVSPQANAVGADGTEDLVSRVLRAVASIAALPLWYLAFPLTLPGSVAVSFLTNAINPIFSGTAVAPLQALLNGIGIFAAFPVVFAYSAVSAVINPPNLSPVEQVIPLASAELPTPAAGAGPLAVQANREAASTGSEIVRSVGTALATVAGLVLAPLWYLAFPITIPLTIAAVNATVPSYPGFDYGIGAIQRALGAVFGWIGFPFALPSLLFPPESAPAAAAVRRVDSGRPADAVSPAGPTRVAKAAGETAVEAAKQPRRSRAHSAVRPAGAARGAISPAGRTPTAEAIDSDTSPSAPAATARTARERAVTAARGSAATAVTGGPHAGPSGRGDVS